VNPEEARYISLIVSESPRVMVGKTDPIEDLIAALLSEGHVLLE